jgi:two-component system sensor histidine kinase KdpD
MLPLRSNVNVSTVTLIFIIPAIAAEVAGGVVAGFSTVAICAVLLDFYFIPPYGTLSIGSTQNWVGLGVYLVVVGLVAVVVGRFKIAHREAQRYALNLRRVYELSELLVQDQSTDDLLVSIVHAVQNVFEIEAVALFVLKDGRLTVAASVGPELSSEELSQLDPQPGRSVSMSTALGSTSDLRTVSLAAAGRPVGVLVLKGVRFSDEDRDMLVTFANDAAIAMERAQLREQAVRSQLLEEVDRLRHALMGAVSHDLRTPLATIKVASSTLVNRARHLSNDDTHELHALIEVESDRLTRLVSNLLDMTRIEAGVLEVHRAPIDVAALIDAALAILRTSLAPDGVLVHIAEDLPHVDIDELLMIQVLVNLLDNARRHSPVDAKITVTAQRHDDVVTVVVADEGPGVAPRDREAIFDRFVKFDTGGRAGLGLTIARTFVEAHGDHIWYEEAPQGGASFVFSMHPARTTKAQD